MLFTFLAALAAGQTAALRPELGRAGLHKKVAMVRNVFSDMSSPKETRAALQAAAGIVDGILAETGNATEHMSDDDAALLREVIELVETSIYGSMDSAHSADEDALAAGVRAVEACNADIADRQAPSGDLGKLHQSVSDDQTELNRLQGVVDDETSKNASAWDTFNNHMQMISSPPACPGLPGRTMPQLDVFFEKSDYSIWFAHNEAAYEAARAKYVAADAALAAAIEAYNIQKAIRDTQYCDWKAELEAACASFDACFAEKSDDFNKRLVPRVQSDMNSRIEVFKAGETLVHQIKFLLADVANQETPAIDTSRYELNFPTLPPKGECDLSVLDDAKWVPAVDCNGGCSVIDFNELQIDQPRPTTTGVEVSGKTLTFKGSGSLNSWTHSRDGAPVAWLAAPTDDTYTFEVDARLVSGGTTVIGIMSVYDGPDGTKEFPFHFGPRTWSGNGVGIQNLGLQDYTGGVNPGRGEDPFAWHRLRIVRRPGVVFDSAYRNLDGGDWVEVRSGMTPSNFKVQGTRIALGLKQGSGNGQIEFRNLVVHPGEPSSCQSR